MSRPNGTASRPENWQHTDQEGKSGLLTSVLVLFWRRIRFHGRERLEACRVRGATLRSKLVNGGTLTLEALFGDVFRFDAFLRAASLAAASAFLCFAR